MKIAFLASTALVLTSLAATPVMAQSALDPQTRMQNRCNELTPPAENNGTRFTAVPSGISVVGPGAEYVKTNRLVSSVAPGTVLRSTPPTYRANSEHREGGSPNYFGIWDSSVTVSLGSTTHFVEKATNTVYTFGCTVTKIKGNGDTSRPNGQQVPPTQTLTHVNITSSGNVTVDLGERTDSVETQMVVCNSPGSKGGQWKAQNNYPGICSTTTYLGLLGGKARVTSASLPPLEIQPEVAVADPMDEFQSFVGTPDPEDAIEQIAESTGEPQS